MEVIISFTPRLFYPLVNFPRYRLNRKVSGSQSWSKHFGGDSNLEHLPRIEPRFFDRPALTVPTVAMRPLYWYFCFFFRTSNTDFCRIWIFFILINPVVFFYITNDGSTPPNTTLCYIILCYMSQFARTVIRHFWLQQFEKHKCVLACNHVLIWHRMTWHRSVVLDGVLRLLVTRGSCGLENILTEDR